MPPALERTLAAGEPLALDSESGVTLYVALPERGAVIAISPPRAERGAVRLRIALTALFYGGVILLILAWLLPLARRLRALSIAAAAFGTGALERRVSTDRHSQLHGIESEFNRMASRIETLLEDNRLLGNAVSHDLRTPLARLRLGIEVLAEAHGREFARALREAARGRPDGDGAVDRRAARLRPTRSWARWRADASAPARAARRGLPRAARRDERLPGRGPARGRAPRARSREPPAHADRQPRAERRALRACPRACHGRAHARGPGEDRAHARGRRSGHRRGERERVRQPFARGAAGERSGRETASAWASRSSSASPAGTAARSR